MTEQFSKARQIFVNLGNKQTILSEIFIMGLFKSNETILIPLLRQQTDSEEKYGGGALYQGQCMPGVLL